MVTLFYLLGVIFFIHEIGILHNPKEYLRKVRKVEELNKNKAGEGKITFESLPSKDKKEIGSFMFFLIFYLAWGIIGALFAGQWMLFAGFIGFGFTVGFIRKRNIHNTRMTLKIIKFDSFLSSIIIAFIILNHFHHIL